MKRFLMFWAAMLLANMTIMAQKMYITIGGVTKSATLVDNVATRELVARLQEASVTVTLNSSGGFEIWGALGFSLPKAMNRLTLSRAILSFTTAATSVCSTASSSMAYTLQGTMAQAGRKGIIIKDGKKYVK